METKNRERFERLISEALAHQEKGELRIKSHRCLIMAQKAG